MSVTLENVRLTGVAGREGPLFDGLSLHIGDNSRVGILGTKTSGTVPLLRLICGTEAPEDGIIRREGRISFTHSCARPHHSISFCPRTMAVTSDSNGKTTATSVWKPPICVK